MLIDWVIYGLFTWWGAFLLNATLFKNQPARRGTAWVLTFVAFLLNVVALTALKYFRFQAISDSLGSKISPTGGPIDATGALVFAWLFFVLLRKQPKVPNPTPAATSSVQNIAATSPSRQATENVGLSMRPPTQLSEEEFWSIAATEVDGPSRRPGLWAKAFAEAGGNEAAAKANYLKLRVAQLLDDEVTKNQ